MKSRCPIGPTFAFWIMIISNDTLFRSHITPTVTNFYLSYRIWHWYRILRDCHRAFVYVGLAYAILVKSSLFHISYSSQILNFWHPLALLVYLLSKNEKVPWNGAFHPTETSETGLNTMLTCSSYLLTGDAHLWTPGLFQLKSCMLFLSRPILLQNLSWFVRTWTSNIQLNVREPYCIMNL